MHVVRVMCIVMSIRVTNCVKVFVSSLKFIVASFCRVSISDLQWTS